MEQLSHVLDCTGNLIFICQNVLNENKELICLSNEQYAKAGKTISSPAVIIELNNRRTRYYYRAVCWDRTLLTGVCYTNSIWELQEYIENPSGAFVLALIKKNLLEGNIAMYFQNEIADITLDYPFK